VRDGGPDPAVALGRAAAAGVSHVCCVGAAGDLCEVEGALTAARQWPGVSAICGVHPHDARRFDPAGPLWAGVRAACADPACVAVGETGLDYHYDLSPRDMQVGAFRAHIRLARDLGKPLCIHTRNAEADTFAVLEQEGARDVGGVIHCFSGTADFGLRCVEELGFYLSIPGIVTFKNAGEIPATVARCPGDRLLVETDSPFLAPMPFRGKPCEPAMVALTLAKVAQLRGWSVAEADGATTANAVRLFGDRLRVAIAP